MDPMTRTGLDGPDDSNELGGPEDLNEPDDPNRPGRPEDSNGMGWVSPMTRTGHAR